MATRNFVQYLLYAVHNPAPASIQAAVAYAVQATIQATAPAYTSLSLMIGRPRRGSFTSTLLHIKNRIPKNCQCLT